jgi:DNA adenine methylase
MKNASTMQNVSCLNSVSPFLKWAGGKRWLVDTHTGYFDVEFERFVEPFLGSAAVYFHLAPTSALLSDSNHQLIETYNAIQEDYSRVVRHLRRHSRRHSKEYYYETRNGNPRNEFTRAAKFIYLNRTCWNGLYRVNLSGEFNVPVGSKTSVLLPTDDFESVSSLLDSAEVVSCDFEETLERTGKGDFVFVDPPYTVKHNHNGFVKYKESLFSWDDQIRLRDCVSDAIDRGAKVLVTNAYHHSVKQLYKGLGKIKKVQRASLISGKASARGKYEEMIVKCF